ncbi:MAG: DUF2075 domain-containing protein [Candidatus Diapherotrites archaeon]|nr:DUF2075 domain-containing protein [Candidatus Diapherotrites archaeon]
MTLKLYSGTIGQFVQDAMQNEVADKIRESFESYYGRRVGLSEMTSWTNSLQFLKNVLESSSPSENMIVLEYELPYTTQRIDCLIFGKGDNERGNVLLLELKQWEKVKDCDIDENVVTFVGGRERMVSHPAYQVKGYHFYLEDFMQIFQENTAPNLSSCVYCHNYSKNKNGALFLPKFQKVLQDFPVFTKEDFEKLSDFLKKKLSKGQGLEIFNRFNESNISPSKKLVEVAGSMIKGQKMFNLIDEQITANNTIVDRAKKCSKLKTKSVVIIRGGPGTGKSVIALNALAELLGKGMTVFHATGSAAFTRTLRKIVGSRADKLFKYFNSFTKHNENEINVLICDEAHRIRKTSDSRYARKEERSDIPQVDELIKAAKVSIFFIDDYQVVTPQEIGTTKLLRETAKKFNAEIFEFELQTQFRCSGSDGYLNWVDNTLGVRETANTQLTKGEKMEFKIFDSPKALYAAIKQKNLEKQNSARLVAGFCWPWSDPRPDGSLVDDVVIGDFKMPWEGKTGKKLAKGIPEAPLWAFDPNGVNQIGCIYTIQGFEFEYVGVIFAKDLTYDLAAKKWVGKRENSSDPKLKREKDEEKFLNYVKSIYRVLLTRGMKGCYVHFMDKNTEAFFKSKLQQ